MHRRGDPHLARQQPSKMLQSVAVPPGRVKSHLLVVIGHQAVGVGNRFRYFTVTDLVETLYRSLADNSVGR